MDSFPMLVASAEAQWRGLTEDERTALVREWAKPNLPECAWLRGHIVAQHELPIWSSWNMLVGEALTLVSIKKDWLDDLPQEKPT